MIRTNEGGVGAAMRDTCARWLRLLFICGATLGGIGGAPQALAQSTWTDCAREGGVCSVPGTVNVRYGANGSYAYKTVTGSIGCNNAVWGDPAPNVVKTCAYDSSGAASSSWVGCASEGGVCSVPGTVRVRYGANGTYAYKTVTGSIGCNNATWGDPAPNVVKACAYESSGSTTTWTRCANEGGSCAVPDTRQVRYGANGSYYYKSVTGSIACANSTWGDPMPNVVKACDFAGARTEQPQSPPPTVSGPAPINVSSPTAVVGNGTPGSCTESALRAAVANGGIITFNCGSGTTWIALTQPLVAPNDRDTTIDGADRIVLDGQDRTQILRAYRADFRVNDRQLAVQRLTMTRGRDPGSNYVPRNGTSTCAWGFKDGGGGAIYTRDVNVFVWGVTFDSNRGPDIGPDVAGGAIYVFGAKRLVVNNSTFRNNTASNGGAIGLLHAAVEVHNSVFENNRAIGMLANFGGATGCPVFNHAEQGGAGGLGGAFYSDGFNTDDYFSKVRMTGNVANDLGGALFRSAYWGMGWGKQTVTWEDSTFERNRTSAGGGGAAYVNNSLFVVRRSKFDANDAGPSDGGGLKITGATIQFSDTAFTSNRASQGGGVALWFGGPEGVGWSTRMTFSGNSPNDTVGVFPR
jgi:hypothetical protein